MIMNRKMQYYKIMLTMKSPVHIGSGRTLKKKEYYYDSIRKKVKIIDLEKFAVLINSKGLFESYLEYMSRPGGYDLCEYFKRNKITNSELDSVSAYEIATSDLVFDKKKFDINTFVKDAYGKPYIPGTSLKGCLRTAVLANYIMNSDLVYDDNRTSVRTANYRAKPKKLLKQEEEEIQVKAFNTLNRLSRKPNNAVNDIMQGIIISDSEPLDTDCLTLCQKNDMHLNGKITNLPIYMECIKPGTCVTFDLMINESLSGGITADFILESVKLFAETYSRCFMNEFYETPQLLSDNTIYIGGNTGFPTTTVVYNLFGKEEGKKITVKILSALGFENKNGGDILLPVSPHILKTTVFDKHIYRMGEAEISIQRKE